MMTLREQLLVDIDTWCAATGTSETAFGLAAINDGKIVGRLRRGKDIRFGTADRLREFMVANPPTLEPHVTAPTTVTAGE